MSGEVKKKQGRNTGFITQNFLENDKKKRGKRGVAEEWIDRSKRRFDKIVVASIFSI